jgi:hypothetical protein
MDAVRGRCHPRIVMRVFLVLAIACCLTAAGPAFAQTTPDQPVAEPPAGPPQTHQDPATELEPEEPQGGIGEAVVEEGGQRDQEVLGQRSQTQTGPAPVAEPSSSPAAPAAPSAGTLPFTGVDPLPLALMGMLLLSAGFFLRRAGDQRAA